MIFSAVLFSLCGLVLGGGHDARSEVMVHRRPKTLPVNGTLAISILNFMGTLRPWRELCVMHDRRVHVVTVPATLSGLSHTHPDDFVPPPTTFANVFEVSVNGSPTGGRHGVFFDYLLNQDACGVEMAIHMREHGNNRVEVPSTWPTGPVESWFLDIDGTPAGPPALGAGDWDGSGPHGCVLGADVPYVPRPNGTVTRRIRPGDVSTRGATPGAGAGVDSAAIAENAATPGTAGCLFASVPLVNATDAPGAFFPFREVASADAPVFPGMGGPLFRLRLSVVETQPRAGGGDDARPRSGACSIFRVEVLNANGAASASTTGTPGTGDHATVLPFIGAPAHMIVASRGLSTFSHVHGVAEETFAAMNIQGTPTCEELIAIQMSHPVATMPSGTFYLAATFTVGGPHVLAGQVRAVPPGVGGVGSVAYFHFAIEVEGPPPPSPTATPSVTPAGTPSNPATTSATPSSSGLAADGDGTAGDTASSMLLAIAFFALIAGTVYAVRHRVFSGGSSLGGGGNSRRQGGPGGISTYERASEFEGFVIDSEEEIGDGTSDIELPVL